MSTALEVVAFHSQGLRIPSGRHGCVSSVGWWGLLFRDLKHQQVEQKLTETQLLYQKSRVWCCLPHLDNPLFCPCQEKYLNVPKDVSITSPGTSLATQGGQSSLGSCQVTVGSDIIPGA